jgi:hypothetical protein
MSESTQNTLILGRLSATPNEWVPMPELCRIANSLSCHTRINDLRKEGGHHIENKQETQKGTRRRESYYRLVVPETAAR